MSPKFSTTVEKVVEKRAGEAMEMAEFTGRRAARKRNIQVTAGLLMAKVHESSHFSRESTAIPGNIWDQVLARVETKVNRHSFYTWFKPTTFVSDSGATITVRVPNTLFRDWLTKHY